MRDFTNMKDCISFRMTENEDNYYYVSLWELVKNEDQKKDIIKDIDFAANCIQVSCIVLRVQHMCNKAL